MRLGTANQKFMKGQRKFVDVCLQHFRGNLRFNCYFQSQSQLAVKSSEVFSSLITSNKSQRLWLFSSLSLVNINN